MPPLALCFFLIVQTLGHPHHHSKHSQIAPKNGTILSSKDSPQNTNDTETDWTIPDIKYLQDKEELKKDPPEKTVLRESINGASSTMTDNTTTSQPIGGAPVKVLGVINAPIIIIQAATHGPRHQQFKQVTEKPTSKLPDKQKDTPVPPEQPINDGDQWTYDPVLTAKLREWMLSQYADDLDEEFIINNLKKSSRGRPLRRRV